MSDLPIILTAAVDNSTCTDVIKWIVDTDSISDISKADHVLNGRTICKINTKYYTAKSQFLSVNSAAASIENVMNRVEAVILYLDHSIDSIDSLMKELKDWEPIVCNIASDAKILVSKDAISELQEQAVTTWCITNEFELIELEHEKDPISDSMDVDEKFGIDRVVEVLQTHPWSNLRQKMIVNMSAKLQEFKPPSPPISMLSDFRASSQPVNTESGTPHEAAPDDSEDPEDVIQIYHKEDMQNLFESIQTMKLNMSSLSRNERLDRAEEMVKKFWSSIGGDMGEFNDSDDETS